MQAHKRAPIHTNAHTQTGPHMLRFMGGWLEIMNALASSLLSGF